MKTLIFTLIIILLCSYSGLMAQEETIKESLNLVNTLTQNGIYFRYSKDTTFHFYNSENGSMDDDEIAVLQYIPESDIGRMASFGIKFENISITFTHLEDYFRLENSAEKEYGELNATAVGISIKKSLFWIFFLIGGLDRTESTFKITPPGGESEEFNYANYAATVGLEAGFEMIEGVFVNLFVMTNQQLFESGFFKGYNNYGLGVEVYSTD